MNDEADRIQCEGPAAVPAEDWRSRGEAWIREVLDLVLGPHKKGQP